MKRFTEELAASWEEEDQKFHRLYTEAIKSIKHPHFQYAVITEKEEVKLRLKPVWKWFSGRKVVHIKAKKFTITLPSAYK